MYTKPKPSQETIRNGMQAAYMNDSARYSRPWLLWEIQWRGQGEYRPCVENDFPFNFIHRYRRKKI